jgi:hypothetical protein
MLTISHAGSTSTTTGKTVQQEGQNLDNIHYWRWVFFPKYIETCGSLTSNTLTPGPFNPNGGQSNPTCSGDVVTTGNVCALTPEIDGTSKQPVAFWAVRECGSRFHPIFLPVAIICPC